MLWFAVELSRNLENGFVFDTIFSRVCQILEVCGEQDGGTLEI